MSDLDSGRFSSRSTLSLAGGRKTAGGRIISQEWMQVFEALASEEGVTVFLGPVNAGKTTCARAAAEYLVPRARLPVAVVDADVGQASVGPPAAVGLALLKRSSIAAETLPLHALQFVGSVSPAGYLLQTITATTRLVEQAHAHGAKSVLVDTSGLIEQGIGFQLKLNKLDLIAPRHIVALQRKDELEMLLSVLSYRPGRRIHRLAISPAVRKRSPVERYRYRVERFGQYFRSAKKATLDAGKLSILAPAARHSKFLSSSVPPLLSIDLLPQTVTGVLVGINDACNRTLALGLIQKVVPEARELTVLTPLKDARHARIIQMGNLRLAKNGEDLDRIVQGG